MSVDALFFTACGVIIGAKNIRPQIKDLPPVKT